MLRRGTINGLPNICRQTEIRKRGRDEAGALRKRVALQDKKSHKVADSEAETYPAGGQSGTTGGCFAGIFFACLCEFCG